MKLCLIAVIASLSSTAVAEGPCKRVEAACLAAGYVKGGARAGRGLAKNCVEPLLAGVAVPGVNLPAGTAQACLAKKAAKKTPPPAPPSPPFPPPKS